MSISAVMFSNVATYGKVVALASDKESIRSFVTARHGHKELEIYVENYTESLLDGLFVLHNPTAPFPLEKQKFKEHGIAQFYHNGERFVADVPNGYLLERSCMSFEPHDPGSASLGTR